MMFATQVEYRWNFWKRWRMVAFAGVGEVAPKLDELNTKDLLPSAGAGLRFMVSEKNRVNISMDYARGKEGDTVYFYIGESF
jgi:outer membrane translocation and assembly module TamA